MACPLFDDTGHVRCRAVAQEITPTLHEREQFCCAETFDHCPTLRSMLRHGRALDEREYLALWLPPSPST